MKFPYQTSDKLPAPIPTADEIEKAKGTANDLKAYRGLSTTSVYRVHGVYAVKLSRSFITFQEAENILFLEQHSKVRVPKVYAVFSHQGADPQGLMKNGRCKDRAGLPTYYYLVMEYVTGNNYQNEEDWKKLSQKAKENLCYKIGQQLSFLKEIPAPSPSYYGRIHNQGFNPFYSPLNANESVFHGPYNSHRDFIRDIYTACELSWVDQHKIEHSDKNKIYLESFERVMKSASGQESRLTHTDLCLQNVMAQPKQDNPEDFDVVIIDWPTMAWMPAYVQAATTLRDCPYEWDQDLYTWQLSQGIKPFPIDTADYFSRACEGMDTQIH